MTTPLLNVAATDLTKTAEEGVAFGEGQAVTVDDPKNHAHGKNGKYLHQQRKHIFGAHQAAIEQGQSGNGHQRYQYGGDDHPGGIAFVGYRRIGGKRRAGKIGGKHHNKQGKKKDR
jgi:hypothetical protein